MLIPHYYLSTPPHPVITVSLHPHTARSMHLTPLRPFIPTANIPNVHNPTLLHSRAVLASPPLMMTSMHPLAPPMMTSVHPLLRDGLGPPYCSAAHPCPVMLSLYHHAIVVLCRAIVVQASMQGRCAAGMPRRSPDAVIFCCALSMWASNIAPILTLANDS